MHSLQLRKKKTEFKISSNVRGTNLYWTTSNFAKHVQTSHTNKNQLIHSKKRRTSTASIPITDTSGSTEQLTSENCGNDVTDCMINQHIEVTEEFYKDLVTTNYDALEKSIRQKISAQTIKMMEQCDFDDEELDEMAFTCGTNKSTLRLRPIKKNGNCMFLSGTSVQF